MVVRDRRGQPVLRGEAILHTIGCELDNQFFPPSGGKGPVSRHGTVPTSGVARMSREKEGDGRPSRLLGSDRALRLV